VIPEPAVPELIEESKGFNFTRDDRSLSCAALSLPKCRRREDKEEWMTGTTVMSERRREEEKHVEIGKCGNWKM
jgi:hypothetical protein